MKNLKKYKVYIVIFVIMSVAFSKAFSDQRGVRNQLNAQMYELEKEKVKLNAEIKDIQDDLNKVDTEEFIVKIAREKLKMVKKNEIIVKYKD